MFVACKQFYDKNNNYSLHCIKTQRFISIVFWNDTIYDSINKIIE